MRNARLIGMAGLLMLAAGGLLLWARPAPGGYETQDLGASLFVLGSLVVVLALLAWDAMNPYDRRDVPGALAETEARRAPRSRRAFSTRRR